MYNHSDISNVHKFMVKNPQLRLVEFYLNGMEYDKSPTAKNSATLMHKLIKNMKYKTWLKLMNIEYNFK